MNRLWAVGLLLLGPVTEGADLAEIKARGTLKVIAAADEAPETFSFAPGPNPGFDRELAEGFVRLHGLTLEPVRVKQYADRLPALTRGEGDVIIAIFDTEDRRKLVDFTVEVLPTHNVAVTLDPRPPVKSAAELASLRVGAVRGAKPAEETLAAGVPASALRLFDTQSDLTQALRKGSLDAVVLPISEFASASRQSQGLTAGATVGPRGKIAWAVRKSDAALLQALDQYLSTVRRGPAWSRLVVKYFGDQALKVLGRAEPDGAGAGRQ
jgi:polar amino acid transport system substrate-binding protein